MENRHQTPDFRHQPRRGRNNNELHEREENNLLLLFHKLGQISRKGERRRRRKHGRGN
jgi:hypothetical protein